MLTPFCSLLFCVLLLWTAPTFAAPLVFDFEDGLQGWALQGSAQRVQTQILGGRWAIFGDGLVEGGGSIFIEVDLTAVDFISVEQFFAGGETDGTTFLRIKLSPKNPSQLGLLTILVGPPENPGVTRFRINPFLPLPGLHTVTIEWGPVDIDPPVAPPDRFLGFIDNITFHPIPEPGHLGLLGLLGVLGFRKLLRR